MINPRLFLCGGETLSSYTMVDSEGCRIVELDTAGPAANVFIQLEDVARAFPHHMSPRMVDLLEIAAYVYTADCSTIRGTEWTNEDSTEPWERDFRFVIPVRDRAFWAQEEVIQSLSRALNFLSNDRYSFTFVDYHREEHVQEYLSFSDLEDWPFVGVNRVLMFSGGLDSLAGALETATAGSNLVLVSHRPVATLDARQRKLFRELDRMFPGRLIHIPVWINKAKSFGREHTQRTRSFLYSALGALVAHSIKAEGVRFFENGVVSLNLPVADEVVRARASRTTHPLALDLLGQLYSAVADRHFVVDNPYIFKTKTDVVATIERHRGAGLIARTCSCAHTGFFQSKNQWHCGTCSQCIDRRVAILAAGLSEFDPETDYVSDVFTGPRKDGYERNMAVNFARHAIELHGMGENEIATRFNFDISRAVRGMDHKRESAQQLADLHKRHGDTVYSVLEAQLRDYADHIIAGRLEPTSMLALVAGQRHLESAWARYCERLMGLLQTGVPLACKSWKPDNERHLQEICDGILKPFDPELVREYPFMRWSSVLTKPDWSVERLQLFVEAKYVRKASDIGPITEALAADITKYGDNNQRVLYVVYDPHHLITDEHKFGEQIRKRPQMKVAFIR